MDVVMAARFVELAVGLGFGAVITNIVAYLIKKRDAREPTAIESTEIAITEKALITAGLQMENLSKDNERLRAQLAQERAHYLAEISRLEASLRHSLTELEALKKHIG